MNCLQVKLHRSFLHTPLFYSLHIIWACIIYIAFTRSIISISEIKSVNENYENRNRIRRFTVHLKHKRGYIFKIEELKQELVQDATKDART